MLIYSACIFVSFLFFIKILYNNYRYVQKENTKNMYDGLCICVWVLSACMQGLSEVTVNSGPIDG